MSRGFEASRKLAAEYSSVAVAYERLWAPVIHPMGLRLLEALPLSNAQRILDLGCGTGSLLGDLHSRAPGAHVIGTDRAEGMLRLAPITDSISLFVSDAGSLPLQGESIDAAVLAFVLFHLPDPASALREVWRTLRNGAFIGIVAWGNDPGLPGTSIWAEELDACGAAADPRDSLVMNHARMNTPDQLGALISGAGFVATRVWSDDITREWSIDALLALQGSCGMPSRRLATLPRTQQEGCQKRVRARMASLASRDLAYRTEVLYGVGQRTQS